MGKISAGRRRVWRLGVAGLLWTMVLLFVLGGVLARRTPSARPSIRLERGPLPESSAAGSPSRIDPLLGHVVAVLAHRRADVRCWSEAGWKRQASDWARRWPQLGTLSPWRAYTSPGPVPAVNLSPNICAELMRLAHQPFRVWSDAWPDALAWSVAMLAHEAQHVSGIRDEVRAECYGMQSIRAAAVELGRTPREGRYLAALYWKHSYPRDEPLYRSPDCRDGGRLDLRPRSAVWP